MIQDSKDKSEDAEEAHYVFTQEEDEEPADEDAVQDGVLDEDDDDQPVGRLRLRRSSFDVQ